LVLVGLEERRIALIDQQRSLDRILDTRTVGVWTKDETERFFVDTFAKVEIEVSAEALHLLQFYAGGLPVLAHEIGDATFRINLDRKIDKADALSGVVAAADIVGRKYLQPKVFEAIRSKNYRTILRKISHDFDGQSFSRAKLMKKFTGAESKVLDNFLRKMMELGVIEREKEEGPGAYRFCSVLHQLYFEFEALHTSGD
jgi:DNA-binding HxlR family transcriptional regulator